MRHTDVLRCFLALRLSADSADRLTAVAERLRQWELPAQWTAPEAYHLTVRFLGDCDPTEAGMLPYAIAPLAEAFLPPRLRFVGLGGSGGRTEPKAVFVAVDDPAGACADLHRDLSDALDLSAEPAYRPHVTVCRPLPATRQSSALPLFRDWPHLMEAHGVADWGACDVTHVVLHGRAGHDGDYRVLAEWPLR